jgi:hypothetical protein
MSDGEPCGRVASRTNLGPGLASSNFPTGSSGNPDSGSKDIDVVLSFIGCPRLNEIRGIGNSYCPFEIKFTRGPEGLITIVIFHFHMVGACDVMIKY